MLEELAFLPRYELRPDSFFALYVVRIVTLLPPSPIQESEFFLLSLIFENPSSTIFCQFFLLLPSFRSPLHSLIFFAFSFNKNKGKQLLPLTQTPSGSWKEDYDKFHNDQKMWLCRVVSVCGRNEKNKGAKRMNKGIQWVERQNAMGGGELREKTERTHRSKVLNDKLVQLDLRCPVVHKVPMNSTVSIDYYNLELCLLIQAWGLTWRRGLS